MFLLFWLAREQFKNTKGVLKITNRRTEKRMAKKKKVPRTPLKTGVISGALNYL
jgi:hypothetical protein